MTRPNARCCARTPSGPWTSAWSNSSRTCRAHGGLTLRASRRSFTRLLSRVQQDMHTTRPSIALLAAVVVLVGLPTVGRSATPELAGQIAFSREHNGTREIYSVDPAVGSVEAVTNDPMQDLDPAWSPDGSELLFAAKASRFSMETHLYLLDPAGIRHQLTTAPKVDRTPPWSPDGIRIASPPGPGTGGDSRIWLMRSDGTMQRPITIGGAGISQGSPAWSP